MSPMVTKSPKGAPRVREAENSSTIDGWFEIAARGSTLAREIRGGLVTFFTMAYILALKRIFRRSDHGYGYSSTSIKLKTIN